jgi:SAM-dependent methyltransferase
MEVTGRTKDATSIHLCGLPMKGLTVRGNVSFWQRLGDEIVIYTESVDQPRIVGISMVKNEQDIIEPFILHNIQFLDALIIADNGSSDATREIIKIYQAKVEGIFLVDIRRFGYTQAEHMTSMLLHCQTSFFADYLFLLDADEFISAPSRQSLEKSLGMIPQRGVGLMPWRTYVLRKGHEEEEAADVPRTMEYRREHEEPQFYKAVLRLGATCDPAIRVTQGNHDIIDEKGRLPKVVLRDLPLLHYPIRNANQLTAKIVVGWNAYIKKNPKAHHSSEGFHWRSIFEKIATEGDSSIKSIAATLSQNYATKYPVSATEVTLNHDPCLYRYKRAVSISAASEPIAIIARSWEQSLRAQDPLIELNRPVIRDANARSSGTSFNADWHWNNLFIDIPPFRYLAEKYSPRAVLDIGCGIGQYLKIFKTFSESSVLGVDGLPQQATQGVLAEPEYIQADLGHPLRLYRKFDLVLCTEVVERLSKSEAIELLNTIDAHAGQLIVFSAAEAAINQPGHGHINCQPLGFWLEHWRNRGWKPLLIESLGIRALSTLSCFRRNLVVMSKNINDFDGDIATNQLLRIAAKPYGWYNQAPGIREEPFSESRFAPGEGYIGQIGGNHKPP